MKIWRIILIVVGVTLLSCYLIVAIVLITPMTRERQCNELKVRVLDADTLRFVSPSEISYLLRHVHCVGRTLDEIDLMQMESTVKKNPMIDFVACYKTPSGKVTIDVKQRNPIFRVVNSEESFYIDDKGREMPTSVNHSVYVPVVTGYVNKHFICNELFQFIVTLQNDDFWANQITQIYVYPNRQVELIPRMGNHIIMFGSVENAEKKLDKLLLFYQKGMPKTGWNRYSRIDLRYRDQVVCVKR